MQEGMCSDRPVPLPCLTIDLIPCSCFMAGVAGYTWVAVLHLWWGASFRTTLMLANITSVAWLFIYHAVLPPRKQEAVSQLHTLVSSRSNGTADLPADQGVASDGMEAEADKSSGSQEHQPISRPDAGSELSKVQLQALYAVPCTHPLSGPPLPPGPTHLAGCPFT